MPMTSFERMTNTLARKPVDQIPIAISPWGATVERWVREGHLQQGEDVAEHFGQDLRQAGWINCVADLDYHPGGDRGDGGDDPAQRRQWGDAAPA